MVCSVKMSHTDTTIPGASNISLCIRVYLYANRPTILLPCAFVE